VTPAKTTHDRRRHYASPKGGLNERDANKATREGRERHALPARLNLVDQVPPGRYESTGLKDERAARKILRDRLVKADSGAPVMPNLSRVTYDDAVKALKEHYAVTGARDLTEAGYRLAHLDRYFKGRRLASIGTRDSEQYALHRRGQGASNGSINRELAVLGRMLRLAYEQNRLARMPILRTLEEAAPRQEFFEPGAFACPAPAAGRPPGGGHDHVRVRLAPARSDRPGAPPPGPDGRDTHPRPREHEERGWPRRRADGRPRCAAGGAGGACEGPGAEDRENCAGTFPHLTGPFMGQPRSNFRDAWKTACKRAGVAGMLRHDLRRTAVRRMEQAGVPRSVAMKMTGHKTEHLYRRYAIVSPADLRAAALKLASDNPGDNRVTSLETRRASN
jgi:hypothetical protein